MDAFLAERLDAGSAGTEPGAMTHADAALPQEAVHPATVKAGRTPWASAAAALRPLLAAAGELYGTKRLAAVLSPECLRLATRMGIATELEGIRLDQLIGDRLGPSAVVTMRLKAQVERLTPRETAVVEHRVLTASPKALVDIATRFGVTRERIRQIQVTVERRIRKALGCELQLVAGVVKEQFGHVADKSAVIRRIDELLLGNRDCTEQVKRLFRHAVINGMGLTLHEGVYLDKRGREQLAEIRELTRRLADDVGLVDEQQIVASLPSEEWGRFWPWARQRVGLVDLHGVLGVRGSAKARAKAALLSIGRPATRREIGSVCGIEDARVGAHLANVPSVVRTDRDRWGLREWTDDEYDGIVGEIIQRIKADGGSTATEALLNELPSKFDVSPRSVQAYMQTARFTVRDGWISIASASTVQLRDLDDVVDGRDDNGSPYWTFSVEARHLDGYSVTRLPPELAKALGCDPDAGGRVQIANLSSCRDLSINWRLASNTGASLGYLAAPLKVLGLEPGQRARVTIKGPGVVELSAEDDSTKRTEVGEADAILERMMRRRRVL